MLALLTNHGFAHATGAPPPPASIRGPKLERPKVNVGISTEEWNVFTRRWEVFRTGAGFDDVSAPSQLFQCAGTELGDSILKANPNATSSTLPELLAEMRSLAFIPIATGVLRTELLQMRQQRDESFRAYAARVRGKAKTCGFTTQCTCGNEVDYTDHSIRDALLGEINDHDIRREILGISDILTKPINNVIALVENKEMARNALPSPNLSAVTSFALQKKFNQSLATDAPLMDRNNKINCLDCKKPFNVFTEGPKGWNSKPHQYCINCFRTRRRIRRQQATSIPEIYSVKSDNISQIATLATVDHHVFTEGEWKIARLRSHPRILMAISMASSHRSEFSCPVMLAYTVAIADTGAQSDLWALSDFLANGFSTEILSPVRLDLTSPNSTGISIEGAFFAKIETNFEDKIVTSCYSMIYASKSVKSIILSHETLLNLALLPSTVISNKKAHIRETRDRPLLMQYAHLVVDVTISLIMTTSSILAHKEQLYPSVPQRFHFLAQQETILE